MIGFVWHIWIGVALVGVALLTMVGLLGYFMISVQRKKYPNGKQRRYQDL
jgi:mannose/fructose/N-acetylgalactosamine-specific phosphotransferase system component IIC